MTEATTTIVREIVSEVEKLPDEKIVEVLDFVRFLKTRIEYHQPKRHNHRVFDEARAAKLYAEAADEDRQLAESGMSDYIASLKSEDVDAKG